MEEPERIEGEGQEERGGRRRRRGESLDEKWRRDPVEAIVWALVLIWIGVLLLLENANMLEDVLGGKMETWSLGFLGAGLIVLFGVVLRLIVPAYRQPVLGSFILGIIFLGIGLGEVTNWAAIGALVLIIAGVSILFGGLRRKR